MIISNFCFHVLTGVTVMSGGEFCGQCLLLMGFDDAVYLLSELGPLLIAGILWCHNLQILPVFSCTWPQLLHWHVLHGEEDPP